MAEYFLLTHEYDTTPPERFMSDLPEEDLKELNGYIQFIFEEITDITESIDTNDLFRVMRYVVSLNPLNRRIQEVKEWIVLDGYWIREGLCGASHSEFIAKCDKRYNRTEIIDFIKLTASYTDWEGYNEHKEVH